MSSSVRMSGNYARFFSCTTILLACCAFFSDPNPCRCCVHEGYQCKTNARKAYTMDKKNTMTLRAPRTVISALLASGFSTTSAPSTIVRAA